MISNAPQMTDSLTGLPDRSAFERAFAARVAKKTKEPVVVSLAVVDIDLFGEINTHHGRDGGDGVLCELASAAQAIAEAEVFRFGGDALAVMLPGVEKEQAF